VTRRLPRPAELRALAKTRPVILNATERRLSKAYTIADLRDIAKRRTPRAVFDSAM
jgi:L-lactate dehydrogenase (cytochrome)